jgi:hypothetical protein
MFLQIVNEYFLEDILKMINYPTNHKSGFYFLIILN